MSDHDATREILAAADAYGTSYLFDKQDGVDTARAHLETTIRRALARGAAIEADILTVLRGRGPGAAAVSLYDGAGQEIMHEPAWLFARWLVEQLAALVAGAGVTTEGEPG